MYQYELYKFLDLPRPPASLINNIDIDRQPDLPVREKRMELGIFVHREIKNWHNRVYRAAANIRTKNDQVREWVEQNIHRDFVDAGVNYTVPVDQPDQLAGVSTGAHTDITRDYTLIYLLAQGGKNPPTVFWQEHGETLIRPPKTQGTDLSRLKFIDSVTIPMHQWCIIDSRILHSVENLTSNRVAIQVGFLKNHYAKEWHTAPTVNLRMMGPDYNDPNYDTKYAP
jgi:hypothetical protein